MRDHSNFRLQLFLVLELRKRLWPNNRFALEVSESSSRQNPTQTFQWFHLDTLLLSARPLAVNAVAIVV